MAIDTRYEEVVAGATNFQKREIAVSDQSRPTDKSAETRTDKSTKKSYRQVKSTPRGMSTKSTKILLKPPIASATMKSTGWSPKRTSKDDA